MRCPNCHCVISLVQFITQYGSDSLVADRSHEGVHKEHKCTMCHRAFMIHFPQERVQLYSKKRTGIFIIPVMTAFMLSMFVYQQDVSQSTIYSILAGIISLPIYLAVVKYQAAVLKEVGR